MFLDVSNLTEQSGADIFADNGRRLKELLIFRCESVDTRGEQRLHARGYVDCPHLARQPAGPARSIQDSRVGQCLHTLLEEEWIALGAFDQGLFDWFQAGIVPEQSE